MKIARRSILWGLTALTGARNFPAFSQNVPPFLYLRQGNPNAKIKILAFMSPSCKECMETYRNILQGPLKTEYLDTGNAYLTILPFPISDNDATFITQLACGSAGFEKTFEFHMQKGFWKNRPWTLENAANAGFPIPATLNECQYSTALSQVLLTIREEAIKRWAVNQTPYFVVGENSIADPNWGRLRDLINLAEKKP